MYTVHISTLWSISVLGKSSHLFASPNMYFFCVSLLWRFNGRIGLLYLISLFLSVGHRPAPRDPIVTVTSIHFWRSHVVVQQVFPVGVALQWRHLGYGDGMVYCSEIHTYALWILQQLPVISVLKKLVFPHSFEVRLGWWKVRHWLTVDAGKVVGRCSPRMSGL